MDHRARTSDDGAGTSDDGASSRDEAHAAVGALAPMVVNGRPISEFEAGFFVGLLVGEGSFGGDGRQPVITLRMHTDHAAVFRWVMDHIPGGRLYGPYAHAGRRYFQWMARGVYLRDQVVPLLDRYLRPEHSGRVMHRYQRMKEEYGLAERTGLDPDLYTRRPRDRSGLDDTAIPPLSRRNASRIDPEHPDPLLTSR